MPWIIRFTWQDIITVYTGCSIKEGTLTLYSTAQGSVYGSPCTLQCRVQCTVHPVLYSTGFCVRLPWPLPVYSPAVPSSTVGGVRPPGTGLPAVAGHRVGLGGAVVVGCGHGGRGLVGKQALLPVEQLLGRDVDGLRLTVSHRHLPAIN